MKLDGIARGRNTNYQALLLRTGTIQSHQISIQDGREVAGRRLQRPLFGPRARFQGVVEIFAQPASGVLAGAGQGLGEARDGLGAEPPFPAGARGVRPHRPGARPVLDRFADQFNFEVSSTSRNVPRACSCGPACCRSGAASASGVAPACPTTGRPLC